MTETAKMVVNLKCLWKMQRFYEICIPKLIQKLKFFVKLQRSKIVKK